MSAMNRVFLMGNLTRDPQVRHTPGGQVVSDLGLAMSDRFRNKAGEIVETTCFTDIVVWGKQAEACGRCLVKGARVVVEGRLQFDQWQSESGEKRSRLRVRADRVQFVGRPRPGVGTPLDAEVLLDAGRTVVEEAAPAGMPF